MPVPDISGTWLTTSIEGDVKPFFAIRYANDTFSSVMLPIMNYGTGKLDFTFYQDEPGKVRRTATFPAASDITWITDGVLHTSGEDDPGYTAAWVGERLVVTPGPATKRDFNHICEYYLEEGQLVIAFKYEFEGEPKIEMRRRFKKTEPPAPATSVLSRMTCALSFSRPKLAYTIYYWGLPDKFYGRAVSCVLTLEHAGKNLGVDYELVASDPAAQMGVSGAGYPMMTIHAHGVTIAQAGVILDVLGEQYCLNGKTYVAKILTKQYIDDFTDMVALCQAGKPSKEVADKMMSRWFPLFESRLAAKGPFLTGTAPTTADFHGVFAMEVVKKTVSPDSGTFPSLNTWLDKLFAVPAVKSMKEAADAGGIAMVPAPN